MNESRQSAGRGVEHELGDGDQLVAAVAQGLDDSREGGHALGAVSAAVVHEDDRAGVDGFEHALFDRFRAGQLVVVGLDRPENRQHALAAQQLQRRFVVEAEHFGFLVDRREVGYPRVVDGVVADRGALARLTADRLRVFFDRQA